MGQIDDEGRVSNEGVHGDSDSLDDLLKLSSFVRRAASKRKSNPYCRILTADSFIAGKKAKVEASTRMGRVNVNKENKRVKSIKKTRCSVKNVADASSEEDRDSIYCEESFIQTGGDWIECQSCKKWAHCKCAVIDSGERYFTCSLCE